MIQHIIKINSSKVASFIQKGEGIPIVFLHGFCEDSSVWNDFLVNFPNEQLISIDLPGFGKSDPQKNCSISDMAAIVNSVLEDLNIKECILIGHSMGGYVALEFAKLYSEKISGLGLFHSQAFADSTEKKITRRKSIEFIQKNGSILFVKQLIPKLFASQFGSKSSLTISKLVLTASQYTKDGIINALEAMMQRVDNQEVLKKINVPVLFIVGKEDLAIPKENSFSQLALPTISDIHILNGVGHMGMFEAEKECVSILKNFIDFVCQR
jgi:pimeloyl-ACP methyl ester carboxylesterase